MKAKVLLMTMCIALLCACTTKDERSLNQFRRFTTNLQQKSSSYTDTDRQKSLDKYEKITEGISNGRYTDEERREIGKLKGQCIAIYAQYPLGIYENELKGATNELEGAIEGFLDIFGDIDDE